MAEIPKAIDTSAVLGVKIFCQDVPATNLVDQALTVEAEFAPGAQSSQHVHPHQEERYEVLSGILDVFMDRRWSSLQPGDAVRIPKGAVHAFRNSTKRATRVLNTHDPGLRFQEYLESLEELIRQGKLTGMRGLTNGIYLGLHSMEFRQEFVSVRPPDWLIRAGARVGAALGFRLR